LHSKHFNLPQENDGVLKRYSIQKLPRYLILCIKRFSNNNFVVEKNPTIVNYPLKNLDLAECNSIFLILDLSPDNTDISTKYDLVANVIYEGGQKLEEGHFKVDVFNPPLDSWFQIQDLFVDQIMAQMIILSESYIQIWKQQ
jgi:U4/U6.U5 tri-snRNP-associated protein 2